MRPVHQTLPETLEQNLRKLVDSDEQEKFIGGMSPDGEIALAGNLGEWPAVLEEYAQILNDLGQLSHEFRRVKQERVPGAVDFSDEYLEHFADREACGAVELFLAWAIRERGRTEEPID